MSEIEAAACSECGEPGVDGPTCPACGFEPWDLSGLAEATTAHELGHTLHNGTIDENRIADPALRAAWLRVSLAFDNFRRKLDAAR